MTIIDIITDIVSTKSGKLCEDSEFFEAITSNYLLQRWVSMTTPNNLYMINETTNKLAKVYENDKEFLYKLLTVLIEKDDYARVNYIKKQKEVINEEEKSKITKLARMYECSEREIKEKLMLKGEKV